MRFTNDKQVSGFRLEVNNTLELVTCIDFNQGIVQTEDGEYSYPNADIKLMRTIGSEFYSADRKIIDAYVGDVFEITTDSEFNNHMCKNLGDEYEAQYKEFEPSKVYVLFTHNPTYLSREGITIDVWMEKIRDAEITRVNLFEDGPSPFGLYLASKGHLTGNYLEPAYAWMVPVALKTPSLTEAFLEKGYIHNKTTNTLEPVVRLDYANDIINTKYSMNLRNGKYTYVRELTTVVDSTPIRIGDVFSVNISEVTDTLTKVWGAGLMDKVSGATKLYFIVKHYHHCYRSEGLTADLLLDSTTQAEVVNCDNEKCMIDVNKIVGLASMKAMHSFIGAMKLEGSAIDGSYKAFLTLADDVDASDDNYSAVNY